MRRAPSILLRHIDAGLGRGALEVSREARRQAPKAFSTLTQSISVDRERPLHYVVAPSVDYAGIVEQGGDSGGFPPQQALLDWIRVKGITPDDPEMDENDLAFVIGQSILNNGTPAQPYMAPALKAKRTRVFELVQRGARRGLREAGL